MANYFSRKDLVYTVYREKSISRAAQKLFISQPSLSVMIQRIEEEVGVPLFDRTCKPIRLTEAGKEYIKATEELMHIEKSFENYLQSYQDLQTGSLTIGSNQLLSSLVLPKYIGRFMELYPNIHLNFIDDNSLVLENMALSGQLDLVLDNHPLDPDIFEQQILRQERLLLAVPKTFACNQGMEAYALSREDILSGAHRNKEPVSPERFSQIPYVLMTKENQTRHRTDELFKEWAIKPTVLLELDRLVTLYRFIEQGTAASIVSDTLVQYLTSAEDGVVFYALDSKHAVRSLYLSYKRNRYYSKPMQAFAELMEELAQESGK